MFRGLSGLRLAWQQLVSWVNGQIGTEASTVDQAQRAMWRVVGR